MALVLGTSGDDNMGLSQSGNLSGTNGNDEFRGGSGSDSIRLDDGDTGFGGRGDDLIYADGDNTEAYGGDGKDLISIFGSDVTANGGPGDDVITVWPSADNLVLFGGPGSDIFGVPIGIGYPGKILRTTIKDFQLFADKISTFASAKISYAPFDTDFNGQPDAVRVLITGDRTTFTREIILEGVDVSRFEARLGRLFCDENSNAIPARKIEKTSFLLQPNSRYDGDQSFNHVEGGDGRQVMVTRGGDDVAFGKGGNDILSMGAGDDLSFGGDGHDVQVLGSGDDFGSGGEGNDTIRGDDGNDSLDGGGGVNRLIGGADSDDFIVSTGNGSVTVAMDFDISVDALVADGAQRIVFRSVDWGNDNDNDVMVKFVFGQGDIGTLVLLDNDLQAFSSSALDLTDGAGNAINQNRVAGLPNNTPTISGTDQGETVTGTAGNDIVDAKGGDDRVDALGGDDIILASAGRDTIYAGDGDDTIFGNSGDQQILLGEAGQDTLHVRDQNNGIGGAGADHFIFTETNFASAKAGDFNVFEDTLTVANGVTDVLLTDVSFPGTTITRAQFYFGTTIGPLIELGASDVNDARTDLASWLQTENGGIPNLL